MRRAFVVGVITLLTCASVDLGACGDKFLRVGRSARFRRYAAVHPASILIYKPAHSTRAGIEELKTLLKQAGHRPMAIDSGTSVASALTAAQYDLVIADYADAVQIRSDARVGAVQTRDTADPVQTNQGCRRGSRKAVRLPDQAARDDQVRSAGRNRSAHAAEA